MSKSNDPTSQTGQLQPVRRHKRAMTEEDANQFLEHIAAGHTVESAAGALGRGSSSFYTLRDRDPEFANAWMAAKDQGVGVLEDRALDLALNGPTRETVIKGELVEVRDAPSTDMLKFLLRSRSEKYVEKSKIDVTGRSGDPRSVDVATFASMSADERQQAATYVSALITGDGIPEIEPSLAERTLAALPGTKLTAQVDQLSEEDLKQHLDALDHEPGGVDYG